MIGGITGKIVIVLSAIIACLIAVGYMYYNHSQKTISQLTANNAKLESAVQLQEQTILLQQQSTQRQNDAIFTLQKNLADADRNKRELEIKLRSMNLQSQARTNAGQLESKINQSTSDVFKQIEEITTPKDRDAVDLAQISKIDNPNIVSKNNIPSSKSSSPQPPPRPPKHMEKSND
jgi:hypothetical protein